MKDFLLEFTEQEKELAKDVKDELPDWQRLKLIARMQVALADASDARDKKRKR